MAATLTDTGELTYLSFNIDKVESTPDGDLMVYGKATDGSVDHDQQIVDPAFSSKAIAEWLSTGGNVRVQHNPQRDPAGIGVEAKSDGDGATWVKSLIVEPVAKKLVSKGALRAYSVGIANPTIERDVTGKARGGIIKAGKIVEISLVDRPANASCGFQLMKNIDGEPVYTGEVFGSEESIQKALGGDVLTKTIEPNQDVPKAFTPDLSMDLSFTPDDLMKLMQEKIVKRHYDELAAKAIAEEEFAILGKDHREFSQDERRHQASSGNALPDGSYPIPDKDALRRAAILARSKHGNYQAASRLIARRARELGVANPMEDHDDAAKVAEADVALAEPEVGTEVKTDTPDIVKDPADMTGGKTVKKPQDMDSDGDYDDAPGKAAKPKKKGGKVPPWVNGGDDGDDDDAKATKGSMPDPKAASGAEEPADMDCAPLPGLLESPAKPHMKMAADVVMRYKTLGMDTDMGMLHDLTCPAFSPEMTSHYFPYADFTNLIDETVWQQKALTAATGKSLSEAMEAQQAWQSALVLKTADQGEINQYRAEAHKAFRDANPGPTSFPTPCEISPSKFKRPNLGGSGGHSKDSNGYGSPNSSAKIPDTRPNAHSFGKPPLSGGHQSPSPSHMKADFEYPEQQGVPTQIRYASLEKEKARRALSMLHDHLNHMFPSACPMLDQDAYRVEDGHTVDMALPVGVGKTVTVEDTTEVLGDVYKYIRKLEKKVRLGEITESEARERLSRKTAERYARSLRTQVSKGLTSQSAVLKALGIELPETKKVHEVEVQAPPPAPEATLKGGLTPDVMKSMMSEILTEHMKPLEQKITAQDEQIAQYKATIEELKTKEQVYDQRWDAMANMSDPTTTAFAGLALNPVVKNAPAGIAKQADHHERVQNMMMRQLERTWRTSENPAEREAAYNALCKYKGTIE